MVNLNGISCKYGKKKNLKVLDFMTFQSLFFSHLLSHLSHLHFIGIPIAIPIPRPQSVLGPTKESVHAITANLDKLKTALETYMILPFI